MKHITTTIALGLFALATPVFADDAKSADNSAVATAKKDIVDTALAAGSFKTLAAALQAAGLVDALKSDCPFSDDSFTVFAPTDKAFAKLPEHTLQDLLKPHNRHKLAAILKYHVVSGKVTAKDAIKAGSATTLAGDKVSISIKDGSLAINDAKVITNDVITKNGIIHVIDTVLLPPEKPSSHNASTNGNPAEIDLLQRLNPSFEENLKSSSGGEAVSLSFCNLSSEPILIHWITNSGQRKQWRGKIEPGETATCDRTYTNHVWLATDTHGNGLGAYIVGNEDAIIVNNR